MLAAAKHLIVGSSLEEPVKRAHYLLTRAKNSLYDAQTIQILRRVLREDSVGLDVGCFEGGMLRHMIRYAPRGKHIAFEPNPEKAAALLRRFPDLTIHTVAVGEAPGRETYHEVVAAPALGGLRRRGDLPAGAEVREATVPVDTLDRLVPADTPVALVKVDVEGGELGVFRGGLETLRRTKPVVVFECGLGGLDLFGGTPAEVYDTLQDGAGLRLFRLDQWLSNGAALTREEFIERFEKGLDFYFVAAP